MNREELNRGLKKLLAHKQKIIILNEPRCKFTSPWTSSSWKIPTFIARVQIPEINKDFDLYWLENSIGQVWLIEKYNDHEYDYIDHMIWACAGHTNQRRPIYDWYCPIRKLLKSKGFDV